MRDMYILIRSEPKGQWCKGCDMCRSRVDPPHSVYIVMKYKSRNMLFSDFPCDTYCIVYPTNNCSGDWARGCDAELETVRQMVDERKTDLETKFNAMQVALSSRDIVAV